MDDKRFNPSKPEEKEDWLMSYADMITLLMSFFVLLISMSHIDPIKYEKVQNAVAHDIAKHESAQPLQKLKSDIGEIMKGLKIDDNQVGISNDDRGILLDFDAGTFFEPASAKVKPDLMPALAALAAKLNDPRYSIFQVEVQGHTDDMPIATAIYPSNWELSAARASAVVRALIDNGVVPTRLAAEGLADTRPKVPNHDMNGNPLPVNQSINRRVTVHIFPR